MKPTLEEVKARYPIGTKYKCASSGNEYILESHDFEKSTLLHDRFFGEYNKGCLWKEGKWAEIISLPKQEKQELIVGEWYKWLWKLNNKITFGKIGDSFGIGFNVSDCIHNDAHFKTNGYYYRDCENIQLLTDLSEIQKYLPEGHPDKIEDSWLVQLDDNNREVVSDWARTQMPSGKFSFTNGYYYGVRKGKFYCIDSNDNGIKVISTEEFYNKIGYKPNDMFNKGDYIVTLAGQFDGSYCAKKNYCFKQGNDSLYISIVKDLAGFCNLNQSFTFDKKESLKDWRYATPEEIAEYDRLGKPFDVTTLNEIKELTELPDKWYCPYENQEQFDIMNKHFDAGWEFREPDGINGCCNDKDSNHWNVSSIRTKITFEQFKRWVLKKEKKSNGLIESKSALRDVLDRQWMGERISNKNESEYVKIRNINFILDEEDD